MCNWKPLVACELLQNLEHLKHWNSACARGQKLEYLNSKLERVVHAHKIDSKLEQAAHAHETLGTFETHEIRFIQIWLNSTPGIFTI